jgi:hypothetical protein
LNKTIKGPKREALALVRKLDAERSSQGTVNGVALVSASERGGEIYALRMCIPGYEACPIKIGFSVSMEKRRQTFESSGPFPIEWLGTWPALSGRTTEISIHDRFRSQRLCGEWFSPSPELLDFIHKEIAKDLLTHIAEDELIKSRVRRRYD